MKLLQIQANNLRGVPDGTYSFAAGPPGVTLITGDASSGKSSLLRAIAAARYAVEPFVSPRGGGDLVRGPGIPARLRAAWAIQDGRAEIDWQPGDRERPEVPSVLQGQLGHPSRAGMSFEWFAARRNLDVQPALPLLSASRASDRAARYSDAPDKYHGLWRYLSDSVTGAVARIAASVDQRGVVFRDQLPDALSVQKSAFAKLCPSLRLVSVEPRERLRPLVWFQDRRGERVEIAGLSDGELQAFLFAETFAWLDLHRSIVLIDSPELHIHPSDQVRFFRAVCELGIENQIIAATTSPAILASVSPAQIIHLPRTQESAT